MQFHFRAKYHTFLTASTWEGAAFVNSSLGAVALLVVFVSSSGGEGGLVAFFGGGGSPSPSQLQGE